MLLVGGIGGYAVGAIQPSDEVAVNTSTAESHDTAGLSMMSGGEMEMSMDEMMQMMNAELEGKVGAEFDRAFIDEMILHHEGAIEMAETAIQSSDREEIRSLARAIIDAQEGEMEKMEAWRSEWFEGEE